MQHNKVFLSVLLLFSIHQVVASSSCLPSLHLPEGLKYSDITNIDKKNRIRIAEDSVENIYYVVKTENKNSIIPLYNDCRFDLDNHNILCYENFMNLVVMTVDEIEGECDFDPSETIQIQLYESVKENGENIWKNTDKLGVRDLRRK